ncbi:MAG: L-lactate permease, partial [Nitriliruptoraceae bacterium]
MPSGRRWYRWLPPATRHPWRSRAIAGATATYHLAFGLVPLVVMMFIASRGTGTRMRGAIWGWTVFAGLAFLVPMWTIATFVGPELPTLAGALVGGGVFIGALLLVRRRTGASVHPDPTGAESGPAPAALELRALLEAGGPYLILMVLVLVTRLVPAIADPLGADGLVDLLRFVDLGVLVEVDGHLAGFVLGALLQRSRWVRIRGVLATTLRQLIPVSIALLAMLVLARLMVRSGMTEALAEAVAAAWPQRGRSVAAAWPQRGR